MLLRFFLCVCTLVLSLTPARAGENVPLTFLDTLNKGKELAIIVQNSGAGLAGEPSSGIGGKSAEGLGDEEPRAVEQREVGTVPSRFVVQVLASTQEYQVKQERRNVKAKVKLPVSISFEAPYYKLMVGDFSKRGEAELQ